MTWRLFRWSPHAPQRGPMYWDHMCLRCGGMAGYATHRRVWFWQRVEARA